MPAIVKAEHFSTVDDCSLQDLERRMLRMYRAAPLITRIHLRLRIWNYPRRMWPYLSGLEGSFLTLGVGYAMVEAMVALRNPATRFRAVDRSSWRIAIARKALADVPNLTLEVLDLDSAFPGGRVDGFLLIDILHHLAPPVQEAVLHNAARALLPNGTLIVKECGTRPFWKKVVNYLTDAIGAPFERTWPRSESEWAGIFRGLGLEVQTVRIDAGSPYAHILVIGRKV